MHFSYKIADFCYHDKNNDYGRGIIDELLGVVRSCLATKFVSRWSTLMCNLALDSVSLIVTQDTGRKEIDIKRYIKIEKVTYTGTHQTEKQ